MDTREEKVCGEDSLSEEDKLYEEVTTNIFDSDHFANAVCKVIEDNPGYRQISNIWNSILSNTEETDPELCSIAESNYYDNCLDLAQREVIDRLLKRIVVTF